MLHEYLEECPYWLEHAEGFLVWGLLKVSYLRAMYFQSLNNVNGGILQNHPRGKDSDSFGGVVGYYTGELLHPLTADSAFATAGL